MAAGKSIKKDGSGKLTEAKVRDLPAPEAGDRTEWDGEIRGLGIRVWAGGKKTWIVKYRTETGTQRKLTIGPWPTISADEARRRAKRAMAEVVDGGDPAATKQERKAAPTVAELAQRYMEQHVAEKNKPRTQAEVRKLLNRIIIPALGEKRAADVTAGDVATMHHNWRHTPRQANFALSVASKMFALAETWGLRQKGSNPARGHERYKENARERYPTEAELRKIGAALSTLEQAGGIHPSSALTIRLLALTGMRLSEVIALEWSDFRPEEGMLVVRDGKAGGRRHPVGASAIAMLSAREKISEWIAPGEEGPISPQTVERAWNRVCEMAGVADLRLHDLRHGYGTYAGQTKANAFLVRDALGHKTLAMTGRYVGKDADPLRQLADQVSGRIGAAMSGAQATVVPAKKRKSKA